MQRGVDRSPCCPKPILNQVRRLFDGWGQLTNSPAASGKPLPQKFQRGLFCNTGAAGTGGGC